ncbi:MAG TPA: NAD-dependent epimerase/dehydratase family protein, partial [Sphingomicrobium sp.]|nr:NAD-dependent epimerase/dehydratase family protein [Sphingomicrobium sp.]
MRRQRLLITGAGGFVGAAIAKAAVAAGDEVVALVRSGGSRLAGIAKCISLQRVDLADGPSVAELMGSVRPDVVIHSAW